MNSNPDTLFISVPYGDKSETVISSRYRYENHRRGQEPFVIIQRTGEGRGEFRIGGAVHSVPAGYAFLAIVPEPSLYAYPAGETAPWRFSWINLYGEFAPRLARAFREAFGPVVPLPERSAAGALYGTLLETLETRRFGPPHEISIRAYQFMMEWSHQLMRPAAGKVDPVDVALAVCRSRFREPLGVKELAAITGLTREHFTRLFTARTGVSPAAHLRRLRTAAARALLEEAAVPASEAALRCGFPSARALRRALETPGPEA